MLKQLADFSISQKRILIGYLCVLLIGVTVGLIYIWYNTSVSAQGTIEHYNGSIGSDQNIDFIPEKFPISIQAMLVNTHGHIISFAFIFLTVIWIFNSSSFPNNWVKNLLIVEPFISIIITFGSMWGIRFMHEGFIIVLVISSVILYSSFFLMVLFSLKDLIFSKPGSNKLKYKC